MPRNKLGSLEADVMDVLWAAPEPRTVRQVLDTLLTGRTVAYTTVQTVMDNLCRKGMLTREPAGRANVYRPAATREEFAADLVGAALSGAPDPAAVLIRFADRMDDADVRRLAEALERRRSGADGPPP
ncbi:BlaI/MecI/CopY family transcriptional regulator [Jiangella alba]|uniref:Predicted transcriptional regulator n=1 Tax=Jiangella alba TaxID=561176 RepID=A0A1H5MJ98_9ACTN|nr:BlaI/MecI/CopY family transcriptional regulator [Jiangella alba]SEE89263.1 Predicted transcriptional regulator [Jiangella alba]